MQPIKTESTNVIYEPPRNTNVPDKTKVASLPVTREDGMLHSFWQPSETDIANILAGVPIRLSILGKSHPAVSLAVTDKVQ